MAMGFNFFDWLRKGVEDSVLLGVSDAVNTMGMPPTNESKDKILGYLQKDPQVSAPARKTIASVSGGQRKLGRSISDIHAVKSE